MCVWGAILLIEGLASLLLLTALDSDRSGSNDSDSKRQHLFLLTPPPV